MKGIIVDRKGRHAVVLTGNGSFVKIPDRAHYNSGHEIEFKKPFMFETSLLTRITSIAAAFVLIMGLNYGVYSYAEPYSYVDFDTNPSVELTANIYDIIIKTKPFNEDGKKLLLEHRVNFEKIDAGIAELVNSAVQQGYLKAQAENTVLLTVTSKGEGKKKELEKHVEDAAIKALDKNKVKSAVISQQVNEQKRDTAKEMGISPGKLNLIEKAQEADPGLKLEDLKDAPVKEIMKHIKDIRKDEMQNKKNDKQAFKQNNQQDKGNGKNVRTDKKKSEEIKQDKSDKQQEKDDKNKHKDDNSHKVKSGDQGDVNKDKVGKSGNKAHHQKSDEMAKNGHKSEKND